MVRLGQVSAIFYGMSGLRVVFIASIFLNRILVMKNDDMFSLLLGVENNRFEDADQVVYFGLLKIDIKVSIFQVISV